MPARNGAWRVEVRYDVTPAGGGPHSFAGFVNVDALDEPTLVRAVRAEYPGITAGDAVDLTYVEARWRASYTGGTYRQARTAEAGR